MLLVCLIGVLLCVSACAASLIGCGHYGSNFALQEHRHKKVIVYFLTCAMVDFFYVSMMQLPQLATVHMHALHGRMKQAAREATMAAFVNSAAGTL